MIARTVAVLMMVAVTAIAPMAGPAAAQEAPPATSTPTLSFQPIGDTTIGFGNRTYGGDMQVTAAADGLVLIERTDVDTYLRGIQEVPYSWPKETLAAQVVAARTYLASTLGRGRAGAGSTYGFDICASSACQVYGGVGFVQRSGGDRWAEAVDRTSGEVLIHGGVPAQTYYHSTSGGRTEAVQDVWSGTDPIPYLVGAASPGEPSPFADWRVEIPASAFVAMFAADGRDVGGPIESVEVVPTAPGEGVWRARLATEQGSINVDVGEVRSVLNRYGPRLYPEILPGVRSNGRRYPQSILSYRFALSLREPRSAIADRPIASLIPEADLPPPQSVVIDGRGWGHHIGMSQYGARVLAETGYSYDDILAHYYNELRPEVVEGLLPDEVLVGLAWERDRISLVADGPFFIAIDDIPQFVVGGGEWTLVHTEAGTVGVVPPVSYLLDLIAIVRTGPRRL